MNPKLRSLIKGALKEDIGAGDITTRTLIPRNQRGVAAIVAKEAGIFFGGAVAAKVFRLHDRTLKIKLHKKDGARVQKGTRVLIVKGRVASILEAERTALNFLWHLSGIATLTRSYVDKVRGTGAKIYDTRKTTPLWRRLEKDAVKFGGGENHRFRLFDEVLVKGNHWSAIHDILDETRCRYFGQKMRPLQRKKIPIEIEVRNLKELAHLLEGSFVPDRVLLDNFSAPELRRAVLFVRGLDLVLRTRYKIRRRLPELEASGGINLSNVRAVAQTGVDRISVGRLTHSAPALDFSLEIKPK